MIPRPLAAGRFIKNQDKGFGVPTKAFANRQMMKLSHIIINQHPHMLTSSPHGDRKPSAQFARPFCVLEDPPLPA